MIDAGNRAVADPVTVVVAVAVPFAAVGLPKSLKLFFVRQSLPALERLVGVGKRLAHPQVHAEVEVAHDEDGRLQRLGDIEGAPAKLEAFGDAGGQQCHLARVAVTQEVNEQQVALARARGQAGARPDARDIPDDARDFGEIGQARELCHQADARTAGRGQRARPRPASADDHADRGQLVLGLDDSDRIFARLRILADMLVIEDGIDQAGRWGDRIPSDDRHTAEKRAERGSFIASDQNLAGGQIERGEAIGIALFQVFGCPIVGILDDAEVHAGRFLLTVECVEQRLVDDIEWDVEQIGADADVHHVGDAVAEFRWDIRLRDGLLDRDFVVDDIAAALSPLPIGGDDAYAARRQVLNVLGGGVLVHDDCDLGRRAPCDVTVLARADRVPGRQTLDIRREQVLAADRDAHAEQRADQDLIGGLAARSVLGGDHEGKIVDDRCALFTGLSLYLRLKTDCGHCEKLLIILAFELRRRLRRA